MVEQYITQRLTSLEHKSIRVQVNFDAQKTCRVKAKVKKNLLKLYLS